MQDEIQRSSECGLVSARQAENSRVESEAALQSVVKELQSELTEQQQMWWRLEADCRNLSNMLAQVLQSSGTADSCLIAQLMPTLLA